MNKYIIAVSLALVLTACNKDEVDIWEPASSFAHFESDEVNNFSFAVGDENATEATIAIPITLMSPVGVSERQINIEVKRNPDNPATEFSFANPVKVAPGAESAELTVRVKRTANLKAATDTIVFAIGTSGDFMPGLEDYREATLVVFDNFLRPDWWGTEYSAYYNPVGVCNDLKLKIWWRIFSNFDDPRDGARGWNKSKAVLAIFKADEYAKAHYGKLFNEIEPGDVELN